MAGELHRSLRSEIVNDVVEVKTGIDWHRDRRYDRHVLAVRQIKAKMRLLIHFLAVIHIRAVVREEGFKLMLVLLKT